MKIRDRVKELRRVKASELRPHPRNWRGHPEKQRAAMKGLLLELGYADALIARETPTGLELIDGHLRAETTPDMKVPVLILDVTEEEAEKLLLTLDPLAAMAEADEKNLRALLESVKTENEAVAELLKSLAPPAVPHDGENAVDPGPGDPPQQAVSRRGDVWLLGGHRLLCGDSTDGGDVALLMNGEKASLLATDPPYLVDYQGGNHPQSWANSPETRDKHWDDYKDPTSGVEFFKRFILAALAHCDKYVPVYQWHAYKRQAIVEKAWLLPTSGKMARRHFRSPFSVSSSE